MVNSRFFYIRLRFLIARGAATEYSIINSWYKFVNRGMYITGDFAMPNDVFQIANAYALKIKYCTINARSDQQYHELTSH